MDFPRNRSQQYYEDLYATVQVIPGKEQLLKETCDRIENRRRDYEIAVNNTAIPWEFPALLHCLEADNNMLCQFFDGDNWKDQITVWPNQKIGPWPSWQAAAHAALHGEVKGFPLFAAMTDWAPYRILCRAEQWNGTGYASMNKNSPYIWGLTNHGVGSGKYIVKNGNTIYDPTFETADLGVAPLLKELRRRQALAATLTPAPAKQRLVSVNADTLDAIEKAIAGLVEQFKGVRA